MSNDDLPQADAIIESLLAHFTPEELQGENGLLTRIAQKISSHAAAKGDSKERRATAPLTARKAWNEQARLEDAILSMYSRGYNAKEIQQQFQELTGQKVSASTITRVTDATIDEMKTWLSRPLDYAYPIVFLDCIYIKVRDGSPRPKAVYIALAISIDGQKEVIGIWIAQTEGAKFWRQALTDLQNRGVQDIFVVCMDGLKGLSEAVSAVFPRTSVQLCVVHLVRRSLGFVMHRKRLEVANDLRRIYMSPTVDLADLRLAEFERRWGAEYPAIIQTWRKSWPEITPLFDFPAEIRKVIYTTNYIESVNMSIRRVTSYRVFNSDEALTKLLYLALRNISKRWSRPIRDWQLAMRHFSLMFEERLN